jgi:hypothetical protein
VAGSRRKFVVDEVKILEQDIVRIRHRAEGFRGLQGVISRSNAGSAGGMISRIWAQVEIVVVGMGIVGRGEAFTDDEMGGTDDPS